MEIDLQHGNDMRHGAGNAARTWTCSMDMDMQNGHGHAENYGHAPLT
jgi:hypothetical protein